MDKNDGQGCKGKQESNVRDKTEDEFEREQIQ